MSTAPRRFWRVTLFLPDGREVRRYIKCPYLVEAEDPESHGGRAYRRPLVPGDAGYVDTHAAMSARLGALEWDGIISSFRVTPVPAERAGEIRHLTVRWSTVEAELLKAAS
jgi:hypothetical protein